MSVADGAGGSAAGTSLTAGASTPQLDRAGIGAAISKLISASIGDLVLVLSKSPSHKHYSLADIEWMVLPPVLAGQFYVAEATVPATGFRAPVAAVTWARVSSEVDAKLRENAGKPVRLRPDEWTSGDICWLIDLVGDPKGLNNALKALLAGPFKETPATILLRKADGSVAAEKLRDMAREAAT